MATAVQPSSTPRTPNPRARLAVASVVGAVFVLAGIALAAYLVPGYVDQLFPTGNNLVRGVIVPAAQLGCVAALVWAGSLLAGANPPHGLRGGIFLAVSWLIATFFIVRAVGLNFEEAGFGLPLTLVVLGSLLGLGFRFLLSKRAEGWMTGIDDQGWLHTFNYKRTQGLKLRRGTMIGILLIGGSGVYTLIAHQYLGGGGANAHWKLAIPFTGRSVEVLRNIDYSGPVLLGVLTVWVAWRAVNMPPFADFLIATEAEMNKVSWSSRRRLFQDTIVVLVTVFLLTLFLLVVDVFWAKLLSAPFIEVLPSQSGAKAGQDDAQRLSDVDY